MQSNAYSDYTIDYTAKALKHLSKHCDLNNPETVKQYIAQLKGSNGYKRNLANAYDRLCKYYEIEWKKPIYKSEARTITVPTNEKLEMLISFARKGLSLKLRISKETGMRPIEVCALRAKDIDTDRKAIHPTTAKKGIARTLKISANLTEALEEYIARKELQPDSHLFNKDARYYCKTFQTMKRRLAKHLNDPSFKKIRLYDFRHYFGTMTYRKYRDIGLTAELLGHKDWSNTQIYVHLQRIIEMGEDEWTCKTAKDITEAKQLIENGFEYVTEMDGLKLFRKRK